LEQEPQQHQQATQMGQKEITHRLVHFLQQKQLAEALAL
jgi:hypothetical protein